MSVLEPIWQTFLATEKYVQNDVLFGIAIQQFFHISYIIVSSIWTWLYIHYNCDKNTQRPPALRPGFIMKWLLINTAVLIVVAALPPYFGLKADWPKHAPGLAQFAHEVFWSLLIYDFFFWSFHYAFHNIPYLWENIHSVHHYCNPVVAVHSQVMHPVELLLLTLPAIVPGVVLGFHPMSYFFMQWALVVYGSFVHGHFDYDVEKYTFGIFGGSITHGIHHLTPTGSEKGHKNFGGFTTIYDRLFGTYADGHSLGRYKVELFPKVYEMGANGKAVLKSKALAAGAAKQVKKAE
jgi:sterol desaturase/sphingolipid hydroxylase (fatty acid hydroxylase superfamily)